MSWRIMVNFLTLILLSAATLSVLSQNLYAQSQPPAPFGKYTESINGVTLELVRIPTGSFIMGNDRSPNPEEKPAHQVSLKSFYMGQYEVTRQQWNLVATSLPKIRSDLRVIFIGTCGGANCEATSPADSMFWDEAVEFCERLSKFTGRNYRLPSESEWEYACRAGTITEYSFGDTVDYTLAHFRNPSVKNPDGLMAVGTKRYFNTWGLFDMHGNAGEWCLDAEHPNYIGAPTDGSAWGLGGGAQRGGYYSVKAEYGRSSSRRFWTNNIRISEFGFRVVAEITPTIGTASVTATSAANYLPQNLAADSLGSLFGINLATEAKAAESLPLPTTLVGSSVFIKDILGNEHLAKMLYASPTQINFQMPPNLPAGAATIYAVFNGNIHSSGTINLTNINPGIFSAEATGSGLAAAVVQRVKSTGEQTYENIVRYDTTMNRWVAIPVDVSNPNEQVFLAIFGTGIRSRSSLANVSATVGNSNVEVLYAGDQGFYAGVDQVNIRLPRSLSGGGEIPIAVNVDGVAANTIKINIR